MVSPEYFSAEQIARLLTVGSLGRTHATNQRDMDAADPLACLDIVLQKTLPLLETTRRVENRIPNCFAVQGEDGAKRALTGAYQLKKVLIEKLLHINNGLTQRTADGGIINRADVSQVLERRSDLQININDTRQALLAYQACFVDSSANQEAVWCRGVIDDAWQCLGLGPLDKGEMHALKWVNADDKGAQR